MTEHQWLECTDPVLMLGFLPGKDSDRKLRLLAVACCRRIWPNLTPLYQRAVDIAEQFADKQVAEQELISLHEAVSLETFDYDIFETVQAAIMSVTSPVMDRRIAGHVADGVEAFVSAGVWNSWTYNPDRKAAEKLAQAHLLREIVTNPFCSIDLDPACLTSTVQQLAAGIYEERAFDRMPILGDALEEAGCDNTEILDHCRQPGVHVRGCWCLDLILGKE